MYLYFLKRFVFLYIFATETMSGTKLSKDLLKKLKQVNKNKLHNNINNRVQKKSELFPKSSAF
jgi:hypothetical protein